MGMTVTAKSDESARLEADLVQAAIDLVPQLAERADEAELLRRLPDETVADLQAAGITTALAPRRHGGAQLPLDEFGQMIEELAVGCGSTAFVASVYASVGYVSALFPDEAQDDIYGSDNSLGILVFTPGGGATPVDGGYTLSGKWYFCSGQHHAGWAILAAMITTEDGGFDVGLCAVPRAECVSGNDWDVTGLIATGSDSLSVTDAFVPSHRVLRVEDLMQGRAASELTRADPYYRSLPMLTLGAGFVSTPLGLARRALDSFKVSIHKRGISYTQYGRQADATVTHLQMAEATMKLDQARFHSQRIIDTAGLANDEVDMTARWRSRTDAAWGIRLCKEVGDMVETASGASSLRRTGPIPRTVRDLHALALHALFLESTLNEMYGKVLCGIDPGIPFA
jgi:alkylation response protein AidB-like acyl-CoA dehydrogenase